MDESLEKKNSVLLTQPGPISDNQPDKMIVKDTSSASVLQAGISTSWRPGISLDTLELAGVRRVGEEEAYRLCRLSASGAWILYQDVDGKPVLVNDKPYGRLRLDEPRGNMKYYQVPDSGSHVYIPYPFVERYKSGEPLYLTEGELKTLALAEEGYPSAALPGFYSYAHGELLPELKALLNKLQPSKIYFIGDNDTSLNFRFSIAAVKLAELVAPIPVFLPRLPLNGPKGIDDFKAEVERE